ncbi:hypothetical protein L9F63_011921, partial [Diploptera punctata]
VDFLHILSGNFLALITKRALQLNQRQTATPSLSLVCQDLFSIVICVQSIASHFHGRSCYDDLEEDFRTGCIREACSSPTFRQRLRMPDAVSGET